MTVYQCLNIILFFSKANGGDAAGSVAGGGGGGRVAMYWERHAYWFGTLKAKGGSAGTRIGGAGTVYIKVRHCTAIDSSFL